MKRLIGIAALLLGLPLAAAQAQDSDFKLDDRYAYWGVELGNASLQDLQNICPTCEEDLSRNSYNLKFGFIFTEHLGIEARYMVVNNIPGLYDSRFFEYTSCGGNCRAGYAAVLDYNSFGAVVKGRYPLLPNVNVTGNVGRHFWNWNSEFEYISGYWRINSNQKRGGTCELGQNLSRTCTRTEFAELMKSRGSDDWTYGAGAEIHFGPNLQGEFAYNRMGGDVFHINNFSVGLALQF